MKTVEDPVKEATFKVYNQTLDTSLWKQVNGIWCLDPTIRNNLLKIAYEFYKSTDLKIPVYDILFLGSSANYNWSPTSDLDLHIVVDITQLNIDYTLSRPFMDGLASKWNSNHEIEIKDHPVEVYLQDIREKNSNAQQAREGSSIFSLLNNCWIKVPTKNIPAIDKEKIKQKHHVIKNKISSFISNKNIDGLKKLMKSLKNYRDAGLTKTGEFSNENLVFKSLRYTGELTRLKDAINSMYDKTVSISENENSKFNPFDSELTFVTYGGLSLTKQKGFEKKDDTSYHAPPSSRGIYAFVWPYIEKFLLGGSYADPKSRGKGQRQRIQYVKDKNGNIISSEHPSFEKHSSKGKNWSFNRTGDNKPWNNEKNDWHKDQPKQILYNNAYRKKFKYNGNLWHHLGEFVREDRILDRKGEWVKTDIRTFKEALKKELHRVSTWDRKINQGKSFRGLGVSSHAWDQLEVFIDEKI